MPIGDIDFTKLSADGQELEQLTRDLCDALRYRVAWSGRGSDDGRDLFVEEPTSNDFGGLPRKWLVSCKDFADSGRSVGVDHVKDIPGRLEQHGCQGFLLVTTTQPSAGLVRAFDDWGVQTRFLFHYWDAPRLKQLLLRDASSIVAESYFGAGGRDGNVVIAGSDPLEGGMLHYVSLADGRSFYFQLRKQPGDPRDHVQDFALGFDRLRSKLPAYATFAVRGIWFDDKHGSYDWRVDVSVNGFNPDLAVLREQLSGVQVGPGELGGQWHEFEFRLVGDDQIIQETARVDDPSRLQLVSGWPGE